MGSLVVGTLSSACGIYFPDQGLNLGSLHWELRVLANRGRFTHLVVHVDCLFLFTSE